MGKVEYQLTVGQGQDGQVDGYAIGEDGVIEYKFDEEHPDRVTFNWGPVFKTDIFDVAQPSSLKDVQYTFGISEHDDGINMGSLCYLRANFDASDSVFYYQTAEPEYTLTAGEKSTQLTWGQKYQVNVYARIVGLNEPLAYQVLSFTMPQRTSAFSTFAFYAYITIAVMFLCLAGYFWS